VLLDSRDLLVLSVQQVGLEGQVSMALMDLLDRVVTLVLVE